MSAVCFRQNVDMMRWFCYILLCLFSAQRKFSQGTFYSLKEHKSDALIFLDCPWYRKGKQGVVNKAFHLSLVARICCIVEL